MHRTYKGKSIDMGALRMANEHSVALGNAQMNARGDILGKGGKVVKTNEDLTNEYIQKALKKPVQTDEDFAYDKFEDIPEVQETQPAKTIKKRQPK